MRDFWNQTGEVKGFRVYFRNEDKSLGQINVGDYYCHKEAIMDVKEALVAQGDELRNKAVLAVIN